MVNVKIEFDKKLRHWDGFGFNYVQTAQTPDYLKDPQEYGGFSLLTQEDRDRILDMVFGEDGLKPGVLKMFLDPFHQDESRQNSDDIGDVDLLNYDHTTTTKWMRYFVKEGLDRTRKQGRDLEILVALYGPPGWMTRQNFVRGRDLDPAYELECAKYLVSWAKYLREVEGFPVKYVSLHNEGEDYHRWPYDGSSPNWEPGHDYNLHWSPEQVVRFVKLTRKVLDAQGMTDVGVTPGETSNWVRFSDWGYADALADDEEAMESLGLITSHGFYKNIFGRWYGDHRSLGIDILREKKPELKSWVTSTSWSRMDPAFIYEIRGNIYCAKNNAVIPWAGVQRPAKWVGGDPNPGCAFNVHEDGSFITEAGYYYYKQVCRAGQPNMAVARTASTATQLGAIAFAANGTKNPDAFTLINLDDKELELSITVSGTKAATFEAFRTSKEEQYKQVGIFDVVDGGLKYTVPAASVTTFFRKHSICRLKKPE